MPRVCPDADFFTSVGGHIAKNSGRVRSRVSEPRARARTEAAPPAMSRAAKSAVFAGEDSEEEESDDDDWLDDVSDTPRAGNALGRNEAAASFLDSPSGTPRASHGDAGSRDGDAATKVASETFAAGSGDAAISRPLVDASDRGATGDANATTRHPPSFSASAEEAAADASRRAARIDANTRAQRRLATTASAASALLRRKHVAGKELGATFLESTGTALQETSMSVQDISNAMRRLQGNLWELASTGTRPWRRVPDAQRVPRDVYEKYNTLKQTEKMVT